MILRVVLVVASVAVAAWFALGWIQARDVGRAQVMVAASKLTPSEVRNVRSLLDAAGTLNPDRSVDETRAQLASDQGDYPRAVAILQSVTGAEPLNLAAWDQLSIAAERSRRISVAVTAFRHIHTLLGHPK